MRIAIVGAGKSGLFLAEELMHAHELTLIDYRYDHVERARVEYPDINVIHGDACEPEVLHFAEIGTQDLAIAVTGDDEDNLVVAMLSKHFGTKTVFARINHPRNEWLFTKEWGVDVAVSSTAVMLSLVEKEIGLGDLVTLLRLQADNVEIEEIKLPSDAGVVGKRLAELSLPTGTHVMAILCEEGLRVASGDTLLAAGDELLIINQGVEEFAVREALGLKPVETTQPTVTEETGH
ncbi:MAG: TrkA family potassium uptake protein [Coriobacteriales bacterium]|nr:TrkA family potassium uptake protein [Coriobacteriales bacterium]